ncbi:MAG: DUF3782 domain-containing protein [Verrucomicrobiales bacterium]
MQKTLQAGLNKIDKGLQDMDNRFAVLSSGWGDGVEAAFRNGLLESVKDLGNTVEKFEGQDPDGFINHEPRSYVLDILVSNRPTVVAEI